MPENIQEQTPAEPRDSPGSLIVPSSPPQIPDHELLRCIGRGSYGDVWLARNIVGTLRAVKIVQRQTFERDEHYEREFRGIQRFEPISRSHEGLVDILQIGRNEAEGYFYYVMELADPVGEAGEKVGKWESEPPTPVNDRPPPVDPATYKPETLRSLLSPAHFPTCSSARFPARLPVADCVRLGLSLTAALEHLHQQGLVHRDIKPSNIIFVNGVPKLADVGLVAQLSDAKSLVGTVGYIPPEGPGRAQADLYSLGKVLYEMVTGKDRQDFPALPPEFREQLGIGNQLTEFNEILLKACESDPRHRYASAQAMHDDLALLQHGQSVIRKHTRAYRLKVASQTGLATAAVLVLVASGWLLSKRFNDSSMQRLNETKAELNSIAVLPFVNVGKSSAHEYLSDALTDETMNALTNCVGLRVASRSAVFGFKRATNDLRHIGEQLGVRTMLAGTFLRTSNGMHLTARLLNVADGIQLWSRNFDHGREELSALGTNVVRQVARQLNLSLDDRTLHRLETNLIRKREAYRLYSQGKNCPRGTRTGVNQGIELLNRAIGEDSNFAAVYAELATFYYEAGWLFTPRHRGTETRKNAMRALEIDDSLPLAHTLLGCVLWDYDWDFKAAEVRFRRAVELVRENAHRPAARTYYPYGLFLSSLRRFDEADEILAEGERMEPNTQLIAAVRCWRYQFDHRFEKVVQEATRLLSRFPNDPVGLERLAYAHQKLGYPERALAVARPLHQLDPGPESLAELAIFQAWAGQVEAARKALEDLRGTAQARPDWMARILFALGERDQAIEQIEQGVEHRYLGPLWLADPFWDDLRSDPRFVALLKKVGLEK